MGVWTEVVLSDIHIPFENKKALACCLNALKIIKPDGITLLGDIGDWNTFCSHDVGKEPKKNWNESEYYQKSFKEYDYVNKFLDKIDTFNSRVYFAMGNHEEWVKQYIEKNPIARHDLFNLKERLRLVDRGYLVRSENEHIELGKLRLFHGKYCGDNHTKKHVVRSSKSVVYGHVHDIQCYSLPTDDESTKIAWSNPCLCDMNPYYLRGKDQNWSHGFTVIYVWGNGNFQVNTVRIQNGKCVVHGQEVTC